MLKCRNNPLFICKLFYRFTYTAYQITYKPFFTCSAVRKIGYADTDEPSISFFDCAVLFLYQNTVIKYIL